MRLRSLRANKQYRDIVDKWGEPNVQRKRTIIAPPMCSAKEKDVSIKPRAEREQSIGGSGNGNATNQIESLFEGLEIKKNKAGKSAADLFQDYIDYQTWIEKERNLRRDLNNIGFNEKWFLGKKEHTPIEKRVMDRLKQSRTSQCDGDDMDDDAMEDSESNVIHTPPKLTKSQIGLLPLLQQPMPVALSIIAEYCYEKKLRLLDLYAQIDKDKNWLISRDEVRKIVHANKIPLTEAQLEAMIIALDADNNDQLDYRELAQGVEAYRVDERWKNIRNLMKLMEAYGESKTQEQRKSSSSVAMSTQARKSAKIASKQPQSRGDDNGDSDIETPIDSYLQLPNIDDDDKTDSLASKDRERRMRKHKERKRKQQKQKQVKNRNFAPSTMEGIIGQMKDRYTETAISQVNRSLDLMHTNGIPVREDMVKRVMLCPFDKPVEDCKLVLRQPGVGLVMGSEFGRPFGNKTERKAESFCRRKQRLTLHSRQKRSQSPFWPDTTYSQLSLEQLGRRTPQESIFIIARR